MFSKKYIKFIFGFIVIILLSVLVLFLWNNNKADEEKVDDKYIFDIYQIPFGYSIYQEELFMEFKDHFYSVPHDQEAYAVSVGKNFIVDFFTFKNKKSNLQYGGIQFIHGEHRYMFRDYATQYYQYLDKYRLKYGQANLPEVINIDVVNITSVKVMVNYGDGIDKEYQAWKIDFAWQYKECLENCEDYFPIDLLKNTGSLTIYYQDESDKMRVLILE